MDPPGPITRFDDLLGQQRATALLEASLASGRVHHAWIFAGPRGVGKHTAALAFASMLLDPGLAPDLTGRLGVDPDAPVQHLVASGTHPDLHLISRRRAADSEQQHVRTRKRTNIPLDLLRETMIGGQAQARFYESKVWKAPQMNHAKVFIIDEAEFLDARAQNALLKTLEEPPARTWIILVTAREDRLLVTIRSRCQRVAFAPLSDEDMNRWLDRAHPGLPADDRRAALDLAGGSPGRAHEAITTGMLTWVHALEPHLARADKAQPAPEFGPTMHALVNDWAADWVRANPGDSKEAANIAASNNLLAFLGDRARARLARAAADDPDAAEHIRRTIDAIDDAGRQVASHVNLQLVCENLAASLTLAPA